MIRYLKLILICSLPFIIPQINSEVFGRGIAIGDITLNWDPGAEGARISLSWTEVDKSTDTATITYKVYGAPGILTSANTLSYIGAALDTTAIGISYPGTAYTYMVTATDSSDGFLSSSTLTYFHIIHNTIAPMMDDITRYDEEPGQNGMEQRWNFDYKLTSDFYITIKIFPPGSSFTKNALGYPLTVSSDAVKTVVDNTPRSYQMNNNSFTNKDFWDCRDSSGDVVTSGIYYAQFIAKNSGGTVVDAKVKTIPVNILRIWDINVTAITDSSPEATFSYTVNGDCIVKVLICTPGTKFTVATTAGSLTYLTNYTYSYKSGDSIPLNPTTLLTDASRIVKVIQYYVDAGEHSHTWAGTDETGTALSSGLYVYTVSGIDSFNNSAFALSGDDYSYFGTLAISLQSSQPGAIINVVNTFPKNGETITTKLSSVKVQFDVESEAGQSVISVSSDKTTVSLIDQNQMQIAGTKIWNEKTKTMTFTLNKPLTMNGNYTMRVKPRDEQGLVSESSFYDVQFAVNILSDFKSETYVYPNPVKNTNIANFAVGVNAPATTRIRIFNILGELVADRTYAAGTSVTWDLKNDEGMDVKSGVYIYKLEADDSGAKQEVVKKLIVIK